LGVVPTTRPRTPQPADSATRRLVDDLLDVSRITRGKLELRKGRVELREGINAAVETARPHIKQADPN